MKSIKKYLIILFMFACPLYIKGQAQIVLKEGAEFAAKQAVKEATQAVAKKVTKEAVEAAANKTAKEQVERYSILFIKESGEELVEKSTRILIKEGADVMLDESVKKSAKAIGKVSTNSFLRLANKATTKQAASTIAQKTVVKTTKEFIGDGLQKRIGKAAADKAQKMTFEMQQKLLDDVVANPQLANELKRNPLLLDAYEQCGTSALRTDISHLRYLNKHADEYINVFSAQKKKYPRAKDLQFTDNKAGEVLIKNRNDGTILGKMKGDVIEVGNDKSLLNMRLMGNKTYKSGKNVYTTDKHGRVKTAVNDINPKFKNQKIEGRDPAIQKDFKDAKTYVSGLDGSKLDDDAGHIVGRQLGGENCGANLTPQDAALNRGEYKSLEARVAKDVRNGHSARIEVDMKYSGRSERPASFVYRYFKDGNLKEMKTFQNVARKAS